MRPLIGITTSYEATDSGPGEQRLRLDYVRAVEKAGGTPLIVPMTQEVSVVDSLSETLDALIMTGGPAITEGLQGDLPEDLSCNSEIRLQADLKLLRAMLTRDKPFLGICYGMQQLNAHYGGTIYADVDCVETLSLDHVNGLASAVDSYNLDQRLNHSQKRGGTTHPVRLLPGSHLHNIMQRSELDVNTRHLQAIASVGQGLSVSAVAPDGVIEGIEDESGKRIGVQFHPERDLQQFLPLFSHFTSIAARPAKIAPY